MDTASPTAQKVTPRIFTIASDHVTTIGGMRGTGKTELTKNIMRPFGKVLVWDPIGQYPEFNRYVPTTGTMAEFEYVCDWVWREQNILFVIEECESWIGENMAMSPSFWKIINRGRNYGIGVMAVTRRIANLSKTVFSLSDHVFLFRFFAPNDVKYCAEFIGREWGDRLRVLPKFNFLYYGAEGVICECPPIRLHHV